MSKPMTCPDCNGIGGWLEYKPPVPLGLFWKIKPTKWHSCKTCKGLKQVTKEIAIEFLQNHTVSCFGQNIERISQ